MRPLVLSRVGLVCLLAGIVGLALRASVLGTVPSPWSPVWTAAVLMLSVVGAGLLTMGVAFRDLDGADPVRAASGVGQPDREGRPLALDGVHTR